MFPFATFSSTAFDPFFSELAAGRRRGLGLTRAKRLAAAMGAEVFIANAPSGGGTATLALAAWRCGADEGDDAVAKAMSEFDHRYNMLIQRFASEPEPPFEAASEQEVT